MNWPKKKDLKAYNPQFSEGHYQQGFNDAIDACKQAYAESDKGIRSMEEFQRKYFPSLVGKECPYCSKKLDKAESTLEVESRKDVPPGTAYIVDPKYMHNDVKPPSQEPVCTCEVQPCVLHRPSKGQGLDKLLPCPFCGGKAELNEHKEFVECNTHNCPGDTLIATPEQWNIRTPPRAVMSVEEIDKIITESPFFEYVKAGQHQLEYRLKLAQAICKALTQEGNK